MSKVHTYIALENAFRDAKTHFEILSTWFAFQSFKEDNGFYPKTIKA